MKRKCKLDPVKIRESKNSFRIIVIPKKTLTAILYLGEREETLAQRVVVNRALNKSGIVSEHNEKFYYENIAAGKFYYECVTEDVANNCGDFPVYL